MKVFVLIGFNYSEFDPIVGLENESNILPGISVDLYKAYKFALKSRPDKIYVITDIIEDLDDTLLYQSIVDSTVDSGVLTFIKKIKKTKSYYPYTTSAEFKKLLRNICRTATKLFIYYTGHYISGTLILPENHIGKTFITHDEYGDDGQSTSTAVNSQRSITSKIHDKNHSYRLLSSAAFKNIILQCSPSSSIFIVMDCCNGDGFNLPFDLVDKTYRLRNDGISYTFTKHNIICFCSTRSTETSVGTRDGSVFTNFFFDKIREVDYIPDLLKLCKNHMEDKDHVQSCTCHGSRVSTKIVWRWMKRKGYTEYLIDISSNTLIIDSGKEKVGINLFKRNQNKHTGGK
jgi:hypothetical protein